MKDLAHPGISSAVSGASLAAHTPGQHLQAIHQAFFNGGGWADPLTWDDYDADGHAKWEAFAKIIGTHIRTAASAPVLLEALEQCRSALDELMGDTDPHDETPALLACQAAGAAIEAARVTGGPIYRPSGSCDCMDPKHEGPLHPRRDAFEKAPGRADADSSERSVPAREGE